MTERNKEEQIMRAKTKLTRLCGILLILALLVGLLPTTALAADVGADFTASDTSAAVTALGGTDKATWDGSTLTLNGVNFVTTASTALQLPANTTIVLNGENTITGGDSDSSTCFGIYAWSNLTISGTGTLNVTAGSSTKSSIGIRADDNLTITGGTVTATGKAATDGASHGIFAGDGVTITGGTVTATGGTAYYNSCGIYADGGGSGERNVTISGGIVTATGGTAHTNGTSGYFSCGICANIVWILM